MFLIVNPAMNKIEKGTLIYTICQKTNGRLYSESIHERSTVIAFRKKKDAQNVAFVVEKNVKAISRWQNIQKYDDNIYSICEANIYNEPYDNKDIDELYLALWNIDYLYDYMMENNMNLLILDNMKSNNMLKGELFISPESPYEYIDMLTRLYNREDL